VEVPNMSRALVVMALMVGVLGSARGNAATQEQPPACDRLPSNIQITDMFRPTVEALIEMSPTLQRQSRLIGATRSVRIVIAVRGGLKDGHARARASIARHEAGFLNARIELPIAHDLPELLAHELEHVIEQIEGVNLAALARQDSSLAHRDHQGIYETARATRIGLAAAGEIEIHQAQHALEKQEARAAAARKATAPKTAERRN
jgi:hypothetical protein